MADLNDILQGLIDTDEGAIGKLKAGIDEINRKVAQGTGTYALVNIDTPGITSQGALTNDSDSSLGKSYCLSTGMTSRCIYSADFPKVKYGEYSLCARVKVSYLLRYSLPKEDPVELKILCGNSILLDRVFSIEDFNYGDGLYHDIYGIFEYNSVSGFDKDKLTFQILTGEYVYVGDYSVSFDYAYITMIVPTVYL